MGMVVRTRHNGNQCPTSIEPEQQQGFQIFGANCLPVTRLTVLATMLLAWQSVRE